MNEIVDWCVFFMQEKVLECHQWACMLIACTLVEWSEVLEHLWVPWVTWQLALIMEPVDRKPNIACMIRVFPATNFHCFHVGTSIKKIAEDSLKIPWLNNNWAIWMWYQYFNKNDLQLMSSFAKLHQVHLLTAYIQGPSASKYIHMCNNNNKTWKTSATNTIHAMSSSLNPSTTVVPTNTTNGVGAVPLTHVSPLVCQGRSNRIMCCV